MGGRSGAGLKISQKCEVFCDVLKLNQSVFVLAFLLRPLLHCCDLNSPGKNSVEGARLDYQEGECDTCRNDHVKSSSFDLDWDVKSYR